MLPAIVILSGILLLVAGWQLRPLGPQPSRWRTAVVPSLFISILMASFNTSIARYAFIATSVIGLIPVLQDAFEARLGRLRNRVVGNSWQTTALVLCISLSSWLIVRDAVGNGPNSKFITQLALSIILLCCLFRSMRIGEIRTHLIVRYASWFMGLSLLLGLNSPTQWLSCAGQFGKCSAVGEIYQGIFSSANDPAEFCMLAILIAFLLPPSPAKKMAIAGFAVVIVITGSRTPEISLAVGMSLALLGVPLMKRRRNGQFVLSRFLGLIYVIAIPVAGLYLVWHTNPLAFSNRGAVWLNIEQYITKWTIDGRGRSIYIDLLAQGNFRGHYPHSEYLFLTFFGGMVAVVLFSCFLYAAWLAIRARTRKLAFFRSLPLLVVMVHGMTEMSWNAATLDTSIWIAFAIILTVTLHDPEPSRTVVVEREPVVGRQ